MCALDFLNLNTLIVQLQIVKCSGKKTLKHEALLCVFFYCIIKGALYLWRLSKKCNYDVVLQIFFFQLCADTENSEQFMKSASIDIFRLSFLLKYDSFKVYVSF